MIDKVCKVVLLVAVSIIKEKETKTKKKNTFMVLI